MGVCTNTSTCVKEGEGIGLFREEEGHYNQTICTGNSSCEGELDWCREEVRKEEKCPGKLIRCPGIGSNKEGGNGTKFIPGQCIEPPKMRDGKENNCLDRSDEDPFQEAAIKGTNKETIIDFGRIKNCSAHGELGDGLVCSVQPQLHCVGMFWWCLDTEYSVECPVLGAGIRTFHPTLCANNNFWRQISCHKKKKGNGADDLIRCRASNSGQCVRSRFWGIEGDEHSCSEESDLYRPIKKPTETNPPTRDSAEADGSQHAQSEQMWKTQPKAEDNYNRKTKDEDYNDYKGEEWGAKYVKDSITGLWMIPVSEETCKASQGFVCKVSLYELVI